MLISFHDTKMEVTWRHCVSILNFFCNTDRYLKVPYYAYVKLTSGNEDRLREGGGKLSSFRNVLVPSPIKFSHRSTLQIVHVTQKLLSDIYVIFDHKQIFLFYKHLRPYIKFSFLFPYLKVFAVLLVFTDRT